MSAMKPKDNFSDLIKNFYIPASHDCAASANVEA